MVSIITPFIRDGKNRISTTVVRLVLYIFLTNWYNQEWPPSPLERTMPRFVLMLVFSLFYFLLLQEDIFQQVKHSSLAFWMQL